MNQRRNFLSSVLGAIGLGFLTGTPSSAEPAPQLIQGAQVRKLARLRVWKLGSLEYKIFPTEKAVERLAELLSQWDGKSDLDLIWGPDIECTEYLVGENDLHMVLPCTSKVVSVADEAKGTVEIKIDGKQALEGMSSDLEKIAERNTQALESYLKSRGQL